MTNPPTAYRSTTQIYKERIQIMIADRKKTDSNATVSISVHNGAAVIKYGRDYTHATATTLCRMINASLDADTTLTSLTISPSMVDVEYTDKAGLAIYEEYSIDPDGYVALATYTENAALPAA